MDAPQKEAFAHYLHTRFARADAITPGQKIQVVAALRRETHELGRVPLPGGPVRVDVSNDAVQAALHGRAVSVDGQMVRGQKTGIASAEGLARLGNGPKVAILAGIFLLPLLLVIGFVFVRGRATAAAAATPTAVAATTASQVLLSSIDEPTPTATPTAVPPSATPDLPTPLPTPLIIIVTPTPFPALQIHERGNVAESGNDPASLELAGFAYILTTGTVSNGLWQPRGAEWLEGTQLRRVVAVPYDENLLAALFAAAGPIRLRLRSGEIVTYDLAEVARVSRTEIDSLISPRPSIAIVLYGEETGAGDTRWVVIGEAVQGEPDFDTYEAETAPPMPGAAPVDHLPEVIIADGQTMTAGDLTLTVTGCEAASQAAGQSAPGKHQRFLACQLSFQAISPLTHLREEVALAEMAWLGVGRSAPGWLPYQTILMDELLPGEEATAVVLSGIVNVTSESAGSSQPVLVWKRAEAVYLITLEVSE